MRALAARLALALALAAGCNAAGGGSDGSDGSVPAPPDLTAADLALFYPPCVLPSTIPDPIQFTGRVVEPPNLIPIVGATVEFRRRSDDSLVGAAALSDAGGKAMLALPSGGQPIDGYFKIAKTGYTTSYLYPPTPGLAAGAMNRALFLHPPSYHAAVAQAAGLVYDPQKGIVAIGVEDCTRTGVAGATVSYAPASGDLRYSDGNGALVVAAATASDGVVIGFNLDPGEITVPAAARGQAFAPAHPRSWPGGYTTQRGPHP